MFDSSDLNWSWFDPQLLATCAMDQYIYIWDLRYGSFCDYGTTCENVRSSPLKKVWEELLDTHNWQNLYLLMSALLVT